MPRGGLIAAPGMGNRIHDLPEEDRPRERLHRLGPGALSDAELIGLFIHTGVKGENAVQIAQRMLKEHNGLRNLSRCEIPELMATHGLGPAKAALVGAAFELGKRAAQEALREQPMNDAEQVFQFMGLELQSLNHEEVHVLLLNTRFGLLHRERVFQGSLNESVAHPREILKKALLHSAHAFVLVHNHPSGDPASSASDREFTRRLREGAEILRLNFMDHIIIGHPAEHRQRAYFSFREAGLLR